MNERNFSDEALYTLIKDFRSSLESTILISNQRIEGSLKETHQENLIFKREFQADITQLFDKFDRRIQLIESVLTKQDKVLSNTLNEIEDLKGGQEQIRKQISTNTDDILVIKDTLKGYGKFTINQIVVGIMLYVPFAVFIFSLLKDIFKSKFFDYF